MIELRKMVRSDFNLYCALYTNHEIMKYISKPFSKTQCEQYFNYYLSDKFEQSDSLIFVITFKDSDKKLHNAGLIQLGFKRNCQYSAEIGIILDVGMTDLGLGTEAHNLMLPKARLIKQLKRIYTRSAVQNIAAKKFCQSLNYRKVVHKYKSDAEKVLWFYQSHDSLVK